MAPQGMTDEWVAVRVWDLPTRIFHWVLAASIAGSLFSAWVGGNAMTWHTRLGYLVFALLAFRAVWGLVGGRWSRFASFIYAPGASVRFLRGQSEPGGRDQVGHSPLGSLSVFALLAILSAQVATGLFANDEIATQGPLANFVADATARRLTGWHTGWGKWLIVGLTVLHVGAVLFYLVRRRDDLIRPMWTGDKRLPADVPASADSLGTRLLALVLFVAAAGLVAWVVELGA